MLGSIFSPVSWLKNYLSHVRETSWHYRFVEGLWGRNTQGKACTYYWFKLPSTFVAYILIMVILGLVSFFSWCVGYIPTWFDTKDEYLTSWKNGVYSRYYSEQSFYPYGYTTKGKKRHIFPWQLITLAAIGGVIYWLGFADRSLGLAVVVFSGMVLGLIVIVGLLAFLITKGWRTKAARNAGSGLKAAWDKVCPPLVVVSKTESEQKSEPVS